MPKGDFVGEFELYVMLALARPQADGYGMTIRQAIEERTGRNVAIGAIYATLGRLEDKGLVRHRWSEPQPIPGGRARKQYGLTQTGVRALKHSATMMTSMMEGVPLVRKSS
ncbi:MAG TPA: PadR family transcriptional regulator [Vicinamibacterales bacterium]|nr:PadR family transcriptional regulator [Vicinamibacterales bacterium]